MGDNRLQTREAVIACCHRMQAEHLVHATAGNVSARVPGEPDLIAMTPTGFAYDALEPEDICLVTTRGEMVEGRCEPTSELPLHTLVYARRPEVGAIVHTHSPAATTMAVFGWTLPPILTGLVEAVGGDVRTAPYSRPGTAEMADLTADALRDRGACFLRHHGLLAVGADLAHAFLAASLTEGAAKVYLDARAISANVPELAPADVEWIARRWHEQWPRGTVALHRPRETTMAFARVVSFDGVTKQRIEDLRREIGEQGRPDEVPATEILVLHDPEGERSLAILFFETEDDYRKGDAALNAMPADDTPGSRSSVTKYDVAIRMTA